MAQYFVHWLLETSQDVKIRSVLLGFVAIASRSTIVSRVCADLALLCQGRLTPAMFQDRR